MFQELLRTAKDNISTVRSIIRTNEKLRNIAFGKSTSSKQESEEYVELFKNLPKVKEWRVYDHCATVTRLYAIYERLVEDLVSNWLEMLPELYPRYSDLEDKIRTTHQIGVGRLLFELKKNRYEHLSIEKVIRGLFRGVTDAEAYELLPDAFLVHEQNLRKDILEKILADAGISNAWNWIDKHKAIKNFIENIRGNQNTAEGELNELISYRNDAAHGAPVDNFLGSNALLELCDFVDNLCQALAELATYKVIERKKTIGQAKEIGEITEWFKKSKASIVKTTEVTNLSVGNNIFLINEGSSCCQVVTVISIQINNTSVTEVQTNVGMEIGLQFDMDAKKGLCLYVVR
jgi:hypothetical protein